MELNHLGSKTIETNNLIIKKIEKTDYNLVYSNLFNDEEVCELQGWKYYSSYDAFLKAVGNNEVALSNYDWIIFEKNNYNPVGMICVNSKLERNFKCEVGYGIHPRFQNKGYATEAYLIFY